MTSTDNEVYFKLDLYTAKEAYGAKWLKIFYHNSGNESFFDKSNVKYKIDDPNRYSLLKLIPFIRRYDEKYEFMIEYPELKGFNRWSQTKNPLEVRSPISNKDLGYHPIQITWKGDTFSGLALSNIPNWTFLDGSANRTCWHFAIGAHYSYMEANLFPGPRLGYDPHNYIQINVKQVLLYIRVKEFNHLFNFGCTCKSSWKTPPLRFVFLLFLLSDIETH